MVFSVSLFDRGLGTRGVALPSDGLGGLCGVSSNMCHSRRPSRSSFGTLRGCNVKRSLGLHGERDSGSRTAKAAIGLRQMGVGTRSMSRRRLVATLHVVGGHGSPVIVRYRRNSSHAKTIYTLCHVVFRGVSGRSTVHRVASKNFNFRHVCGGVVEEVERTSVRQVGERIVAIKKSC